MCVQWEIDCSKVPSLPNLNVVLNGVTYTMTGEQYILQVTEAGETVCLSGAHCVIMHAIPSCSIVYYSLTDAWLASHELTLCAGIFGIDVPAPYGPLIILGWGVADVWCD